MTTLRYQRAIGKRAINILVSHLLLDPTNRLLYIAKVTDKARGGAYFRLRKYSGRRDCIYKMHDKKFEWKKGALCQGPDDLVRGLKQSIRAHESCGVRSEVSEQGVVDCIGAPGAALMGVSELRAETKPTDFLTSLTDFSKQHRAQRWEGSLGDFLTIVLPTNPTALVRQPRIYMGHAAVVGPTYPLTRDSSLRSSL